MPLPRFQQRWRAKQATHMLRVAAGVASIRHDPIFNTPRAQTGPRAGATDALGQIDAGLIGRGETHSSAADRDDRAGRVDLPAIWGAAMSGQVDYGNVMGTHAPSLCVPAGPG
jgi:hypothetical protein